MDVELLHTADGGEITIANGIAKLADGLETAVYLSLFGGNEGDDGSDGARLRQWWGNLSESDPAKRYRSETHGLLHGLPMVPSNLRRIEDAANNDLAWLLDVGLVTSVVVTASIPGVKQLGLLVELASDLGDRKYSFVFEQRTRVTA